MTIGMADSPTTVAQSASAAVSPHALAAILGAARLRVLCATVVICLLISLADVVGAIAGFTPSGGSSGLAVVLGASWCVLWTLAAVFPSVAARCFANWRTTMSVLAGLNTATVAMTGGLASPLLAVCTYVGWIASVVVPRAALTMSLAMTSSIVAGYLLAGDSVADILTGPSRYGAVTNAALPILTGIVGVLITSVTNTIVTRLPETLDGLRRGLPATTPGLTDLMAGRPVLELAAGPTPAGRRGRAGAPLTDAEYAVVRGLADGLAPKQIAHQRGVTIGTVRSHIKRAKAKTGAKTLPELVRHLES